MAYSVFFPLQFEVNRLEGSSPAAEAVQGEYVDCRTVAWQDEACISIAW